MNAETPGGLFHIIKRTVPIKKSLSVQVDVIKRGGSVLKAGMLVYGKRDDGSLVTTTRNVQRFRRTVLNIKHSVLIINSSVLN